MRRTWRWSVARLSSVSRWARRPAWPLVAVFLGVGLAGVLAFANSAQASTTYKLTLAAQGTTGVSLSSTSCAAATTTLESKTSATRYTLAVAPLGFPPMKITGVSIATNATPCTTLVLSGTSTVFGKAVTVLVAGTWTSTTATTPTFTVAIDFGSVGLDQLLASSAGANVGATLSHAWLVATTASGGSSLSVTPSATTGALAALRQFFSGFQGNTVSVSGSGLTFVGDLANTGDLATGLSKLGISNVQLTGKLVGALSDFTTSAPPSTSDGFTVTASFGLNIPDAPGWLKVPSTPFTLTISGKGSGNWSVAVAGKATVTLPPNTATAQLTANFTISKSGASAPVTVGLSIQMGRLSSAFGLSWLTLTTTKLTWTVSTTTLKATLHAKLTLGTSPTTVALTAMVTLSSATGATATLSLKTSSSTLSTTHLATDLGLSLPTHTPTVTLKDLDVYLKVPKSGSVTVAAEAGATLTIGSSSTAVSFLVRDEVGTSLIVAAKTTTAFTLKQLVSTIPTMVDVSLTHLAVVFSTSSSTLKSTALDAATKAFFQPLYCSSDTTCTFTVKVKSGVTIQAAVGLPTSVKRMVCKLVDPTTTPTPTTCLTGPITIDGHIPLFQTASTVSLRIALPTVRISSGPVRRLTLALTISEAAAKFSVSASGDLVLLAPSTDVVGSGNCPAGVTRPSTDVCLTLTVAGTLSAGAEGVSVTFSAVLTAGHSWRLPHPVTWLTIDRLAVQIGITANETGPGLTFGVGGTFTVGTELGFAVHLKATPEAPWIELLGFKVQSTTGISMHDLAALYHDVSGQALTPNSLPPLALKDLLFEYSATNDPTLRLCAGLHISADLVITNGRWTQGFYTAPTSATCNVTSPTRSTACMANKSSCLASILLTISSTGFIGYGHLTGWSAGPLEFTPVTLGVTLTSKEVQIHISGGGRLLNPITWPTKRTQSPEWLGGSITLTVGTQRLHLTATGDIGDLSATISGTGSLSDLENPGFTLTSWFTTTKTAIETAGNHIKSAFTTVGATVSAWYTAYVATTGNEVVGNIQSAFRFFGNTGPPTWVKIEAVFSQITSAISSWNNGVNSAGLSFLDITSGAIFNDVLHGIHVNGWTVCLFGKCVTIIPGFTIPGVCSYVSTLEGTPLCTSSTLVAGAQRVYANPTVTSHLKNATLALPPSSTDKTLVTKLHSLDPAGTTGSPITCAMATENYTSGVESPTTFQVNTLGNTVMVSGPEPTALGNANNQTSTNTMLGQHTLNDLYSGQNQGTCTPPTATSTIPKLSMGLKQAWIYEGGTVTAVVRAGTGVTGVTVTWGDGSKGPATYTGTNQVYVAGHVYLDATGANGATSPFTVTASATVNSGEAPTPVTSKVSVLVPPPQLSNLTVTPSTINVMQTVAVSGKLVNPEPQSATGTITWGDGTQTPLEIAPTGGFSATHRYDRLTPTGSPKQTETISVVVSRADTTGQTLSSVTVNDVSPTDLISPTSGGIVANHGTVFTHSGSAIGWGSQVLDVSPVQRFTFSFDWDDGTPVTRSIVTAPTPSTPNAKDLYTYPIELGTISHTFADACLYTVKTTATDDDDLSATLTTPVVVTAPLGFIPAGPGYWHRQFTSSHPWRGKLGAATLGCYLSIAQHLSPELGPNLTPAAAALILQPEPSRSQPSPTWRTDQLVAQLRQQLLTVLLDFANGSWNWTQPGGPDRANLQTLVWNANQALTSKTRRAMYAALTALDLFQSPQPPANLMWSPNTNGIYSFGTVKAGTAVTQMFTLKATRGPLPSVVTVALTGSPVFSIVANTCPSKPSPHEHMPPPPRTTCAVTVRFAPTASDTPYSATMTVTVGPPPFLVASPAVSLTLSGTST